MFPPHVVTFSPQLIKPARSETTSNCSSIKWFFFEFPVERGLSRVSPPTVSLWPNTIWGPELEIVPRSRNSTRLLLQKEENLSKISFAGLRWLNRFCWDSQICEQMHLCISMELFCKCNHGFFMENCIQTVFYTGSLLIHTKKTPCQNSRLK